MGVNRREFIKTSLAAGVLTSLDLKLMRFAGPEAIATTVQVPGTGYVHKGAFVRLAGLAR
jgi:hypothetical protein